MMEIAVPLIAQPRLVVELACIHPWNTKPFPDDSTVDTHCGAFFISDAIEPLVRRFIGSTFVQRPWQELICSCRLGHGMRARSEE